MSKLLHLVALSVVVFLGVSNGPQPANALSIHARSPVSSPLQHGSIAKRKRGIARRCKPRNPQPEPEPPKEEEEDHSGSDGGNEGGNQDGGASPPSSGGISRLGFAWVMGNEHLPKYKQNKQTLIYNWGPTGPNADGFIFAPMIWGNDGNKIQQFNDAVNKKVPEYALGPNEPELNNNSGLSAGLTPDAVVQVYWSTLDPLAKKGVKVLTPAVTSGPAGFKWMDEFMGKCGGCQFHGQALHWYDTTADKAIAHFKEHHERFGLDIYCTEIAFNNFNGGAQLSWQQAYDEMHKFNMWVKETPWMKVVMYFGFQDDMVNVSPTLKLINSDHTPNDLGWMVINDLSE